ncbi:bactofilin family protein (plasmid) [Massilia varians]
MTTSSDLSLGAMPSLDTPHVHKQPPAAPPVVPSAHHPYSGETMNESSLSEYVASGATAEALCETLDISMAIGTDDLIEGTIRIGGNKSLVIRGKVMGNVECAGRVLVMPGGVVQGNIHAASLWNEGDIGVQGQPTTVNVGDLHLGVGSKVIGDCIYDTFSVATPNRGVRGQMIPRSEADHA